MSFKIEYRTADGSLQDILGVKQFVFNDGSVNVELENPSRSAHVISNIIIKANMQSPADQMALVMIVNALRLQFPLASLSLYMPFTPYGRQDAMFCKGQANAMKAWADIINSLKFAEVTVVDPHSIAVSHLDNCTVVDVCDLLKSVCYTPSYKISKLLNSVRYRPEVALVSPDAGANKKAHKIAEKFGFQQLVRADKARDLATGNILETEVYGDVEGKTCVIMDDICDGGATFIALGNALRAKGASKVILYVTHGIFSKGLSVFNGIIDEIYTTDTWKHEDTSYQEGYTGTYEVIES